MLDDLTDLHCFYISEEKDLETRRLVFQKDVDLNYKEETIPLDDGKFRHSLTPINKGLKIPFHWISNYRWN